MIIEFMLNNVKDISLIYSIEEKYDENFCEYVKEESYLGTNYCSRIVLQLQSNFSEIKKQMYKGQTERIAHEEYEIETLEGKYSISFTIDTFQDKSQTQLGVCIFSLSDSGEYDTFLEKLKIYLKEILLKEWELCTWLIDEQSEYLGMRLYPLIFKTENKMRAFINKVLTRKFGIKWMESIGLEDIIKGHDRSSVDFKRKVPEFNNINDFLLCATAESLAKLMLKSKVFETAITLSDAESIRIHQKLSEDNRNSIVDTLLEARKVKVDVWKDIFEKYFDESIQKEITDFIKNRNHVAHNKLLTNASYCKMKDNIIKVKTLFDEAEELFMVEEASDELFETWSAEQEEIRNEKEYIYDRIKNETGIEVLFPEEILELFETKIQELYTEIDDAEYFSYAVIVSSLNDIQDDPHKQVLFSVESNVDSRFSFNVCGLIEITEGMGEESTLTLWIEKEDDTILYERKIMYYNGEAHEDVLECYYVPDSNSFFEDGVFKEFMEDLKNYISDEMNTTKKEADYLSYIAKKDGSNSPVADFPCWNCSENYISIDDNLYPYGRCINCGEENEILQCSRCECLYPASEGGEYMGSKRLIFGCLR